MASPLKTPQSLLVILGWCIGLAYVDTGFSFLAEQQFGDNGDGSILGVSATPSGRLFSFFLNGVGGFGSLFILVSWCALCFGIKYYQALQAERYCALAAESSAREAEVRALRYQVHPHFLFNTSNAISTLVLAGRSEVAILMIARLGDFLRTTLEGNSSHEVRLTDEILFTEQYLEIEKLRFGD